MDYETLSHFCRWYCCCCCFTSSVMSHRYRFEFIIMVFIHTLTNHTCNRLVGCRKTNKYIELCHSPLDQSNSDQDSFRSFSDYDKNRTLKNSTVRVNSHRSIKSIGTFNSRRISFVSLQSLLFCSLILFLFFVLFFCSDISSSYGQVSKTSHRRIQEEPRHF